MSNVNPACLSVETGEANDCILGEETSLIQTEIAGELCSEEFILRIKPPVGFVCLPCRRNSESHALSSLYFSVFHKKTPSSQVHTSLLFYIHLI